MKKMLSLFACSAFAISLAATPIHAAEGINENEERLLAYVENGINIKDNFIDTNEVYYNDVKAILSADGVDLTSADVDTAVAAAKDTQAFLELHWEDAVTVDLMSELISKMSPATEVLGIQLSYNATDETIELKDANGNVIDTISVPLGVTPAEEVKKEETKALENTGENFTSTYAIIGGLLAVLAGAGYFTMRKKETI